MKAYFIPLALLGVTCLTACWTRDNEKSGTADSISVRADTVAVSTESVKKDTTVMNTLSTEQVAAGWTLLFDGKDLKGWHPYKGQTTSNWAADDGLLHCRPGGRSADLTSDGTYDDFEFEADWKIAPQGNSGIIYLASEEYDQPYLSGPEYQIVDDVNFPEKLEGWQKAGANYAMATPFVAAANPAGEWNHARIISMKGHVEHWLNGKKVAEYQIGSAEWKAAKAAGKWKDAQGYGATKKGHIDFQDHGSEVWFKNVKIKVL
jgi:hypothetical protein